MNPSYRLRKTLSFHSHTSLFSFQIRMTLSGHGKSRFYLYSRTLFFLLCLSPSSRVSRTLSLLWSGVLGLTSEETLASPSLHSSHNWPLFLALVTEEIWTLPCCLRSWSLAFYHRGQSKMRTRIEGYSLTLILVYYLISISSVVTPRPTEPTSTVSSPAPASASSASSSEGTALPLFIVSVFLQPVHAALLQG